MTPGQLAAERPRRDRPRSASAPRLLRRRPGVPPRPARRARGGMPPGHARPAQVPAAARRARSSPTSARRARSSRARSPAARCARTRPSTPARPRTASSPRSRSRSRRSSSSAAQTQFQVFCSPCHGRTGRGDGMIVQRGFKKPSSYHVDRLRQMPIGYFYDVITHRLRRDVRLRRAGAAAGPLGDRRLRPHAAVQPVRAGLGRARRQARRARAEPRPRRPRPPRRRSTTDERAARSAVLERLEKTGLGRGRGASCSRSPPASLADRAQFFRSYLFGYLFWVGVGVGSLGLAMLSHLTGGLWGLVPRRLPRGGGPHAAGDGARVRPGRARRLLDLHLGAAPRSWPRTRCCRQKAPT